ncbi:hypothetical protein BDN70DRAFT_977459, partial [Pholiota conissans]
MFNRWLSRSRQYPLSIRLTEDPRGVEIKNSSFLNVLIPHAYRLQNMELMLPEAWIPILLQIAKQATQLKSLNTSANQFKAFATIPQLRDVSVVGYHVPNLTFPWAQIQRLDAGWDSMDNCFKVLQVCPRLRSCTLLVKDNSSLTLLASEMQHTTLDVIAETGEVLDEFLELLTLPALRSFSVGIKSKESSVFSLLPLIARSGCKLDSLFLFGVTPSSDVAECLHAAPDLRNL